MVEVQLRRTKPIVRVLFEIQEVQSSADKESTFAGGRGETISRSFPFSCFSSLFLSPSHTPLYASRSFAFTETKTRVLTSI